MTGGTVTPWIETLLAAKKKYMENANCRKMPGFTMKVVQVP